jgi:hypothetical protein
MSNNYTSDNTSGPRIATKASSASPQTNKRRCVRDSLDDEAYDAFVKWLKNERIKESRTLSRTEKLDILAVQAYIRHEAFVSARKSGRPASKDFNTIVSEMLRRKMQRKTIMVRSIAPTSKSGCKSCSTHWKSEESRTLLLQWTMLSIKRVCQTIFRSQIGEGSKASKLVGA